MARHLTDDQRKNIYFILLVANILSALGSSFIISIYLSFESLKKFAFTLIFVLAVLDLFNSIGFIIPAYDSQSSSPECQAQAALTNFFTILGVFWAGYIALSLYIILAKNKTYPEKYWKHSLLVLTIISIVFTITPIITNSYGKVAGWCWIKQTGKIDSGFYERNFLFFIPLWLTIMFIIALYISLLRVLRHNYNDECTIKSLNKKLTYYPIILVFSFLPYTVKAVIELSDAGLLGEREYEFTIIAGVFRALNGFLNAIVYGYTKKVKGLLKDSILGKLCSKETKPITFKYNSTVQGSQCTVFSEVSQESD